MGPPPLSPFLHLCTSPIFFFFFFVSSPWNTDDTIRERVDAIFPRDKTEMTLDLTGLWRHVFSPEVMKVLLTFYSDVRGLFFIFLIILFYNHYRCYIYWDIITISTIFHHYQYYYNHYHYHHHNYHYYHYHFYCLVIITINISIFIIIIIISFIIAVVTVIVIFASTMKLIFSERGI